MSNKEASDAADRLMAIHLGFEESGAKLDCSCEVCCLKRETFGFRRDLGRKIAEISKQCRDGYRRNINQFNTSNENVVAERCAIAAANTGWFILRALEFSDEEIKAFRDEGASSTSPLSATHEDSKP